MLDGLVADAEIGPWTIGPISLTDVVRYQGASGDLNPIHHDADYARAAGYRGPIVVGMLVAAHLGRLCAEIFGSASVRSFHTTFAALVYPGEQLTVRGRVVEVGHRHGERLVRLDLTATTPAGRVAVEAAAAFAVTSDQPSRPAAAADRALATGGSA